MNPETDAYIAQAPPEQQPLLRELHALIRSTLPSACEHVDRAGMVVFTHGSRWIAGFGFRKKGPMFYVMQPGALDRHAERIGRLRTGHSCVDWRPSQSLDAAALRELARQILAEVAAELSA